MKFVNIPVAQEAATEVQQSMHRIMVADCSGSMYSELKKLRLHLKNKLPTMVLPGDTLSIVWFSGKGQCGVLFQNIEISTLQDISKVNDAIDRYLVDVGLTCFTDPLEKVLKIVQESSDRACTLNFFTDGRDNSSTKSQILMACKNLSDSLAAATFVSYGYYADDKLLLEMAESVGGTVISSEDFTSYTEQLEQSFKSTSTAKKIKVTKITAEFVVGQLADGFVVAKPDAVGTVTLPANVISYSFIEPTENTTVVDEDAVGAACFMVAALTQRGDSASALELSSSIGDVVLYEQVQNSFSKQDYAVTVELAIAYGSGKLKLFSNSPRKTGLIPDENSYNVLTMLMDLASEPGNYLHISHPDFVYNAIGAKRETVEDDSGFKPVFTDKAGEIKAEISALKFDEDRPNISILTRRDGTVSLPDNELGFGNSVESFIWRNYAVVRDGIVNVRKLPLILSKNSHDLLSSLGVIDTPFKINQTVVIDTKKLPIINRSMVGKTTAADLFTKCFSLYKLRTLQKVLGALVEKPEFSLGFVAKYGEEGAAFLKTYGVSDGGFSPKSGKAIAVDSYVAKVLEIKLAGLSSIPKVSDVEAAITKGKTLTPSQQVMKEAMDKVATMTDYATELKLVKNDIKDVLNQIVMQKFGIILGKQLPIGLKSWDDNTLELDFGLGKLTKCTALLEDKEI